MKKQTKLVAVLSTASLLAIGASMTSFAATGWTEEDGTWVYYNSDGDRATNEWKKSGNSWYYLDDNGEMAIDQLIEEDDDYYYVDINGVMATNQWVAIENEDAGEDDEPENNWYYFQANGKALTNGDNDKVSLKTINGKKYAFDDEGKMLWGWVDEDSAEHIDNTDGDAFKEGDYYFGGSDDGAMTVGWLQIDITYEEATQDDYKHVSPVFNDDEDQTRWFYFKSNGKKVYAEDAGDITKDRTINGRKYAFDEFGAMVAEWSLDSSLNNTNNGGTNGITYSVSTSNSVSATGSVTVVNGTALHGTTTGSNVTEGKAFDAKYTEAWRYFSDVEDGARVSRGWFKVVPAEYLNEEKYDDDESYWYYADGKGSLYAGDFKTINGKKYAFRDDGRMIDGLKFIYEEKRTGYSDHLDVRANDDNSFRFDSEDDFDANAPVYEAAGYKCYYFGDSEDGVMKTGKTTLDIDGENYSFYFEKSGGNKGAGITGEKDDKYYQSGKLLEADSDTKYVVVKAMHVKETDGVIAANVDDLVEVKKGSKDSTTVYTKYDDAEDLLEKLGTDAYFTKDQLQSHIDAKDVTLAEVNNALDAANINKDFEDLSEVYLFCEMIDENKDGDPDVGKGFAKIGYKISALDFSDYFVVNASGKVTDSKARNKDGNDFVYAVTGNGDIAAVYVED